MVVGCLRRLKLSFIIFEARNTALLAAAMGNQFDRHVYKRTNTLLAFDHSVAVVVGVVVMNGETRRRVGRRRVPSGSRR